MDVNSIIFYFLAALAVISAVLMVTRRSAVHSAIYLITTLLATAGIFLQLQAEFLFAVQIILYVGGIMVLFLFVIMLVNLDVSMRQAPFRHRGWVAALLALILGGQLFVALHYGAGAFNLQAPAAGMVVPPNAEAVGTGLFQNYVLPFEIASILLLVAMVGAVVMSKKEI
jgi:NADH-quinone oxidoreductase subunit J